MFGCDCGGLLLRGKWKNDARFSPACYLAGMAMFGHDFAVFLCRGTGLCVAIITPICNFAVSHVCGCDLAG